MLCLCTESLQESWEAVRLTRVEERPLNPFLLHGKLAI